MAQSINNLYRRTWWVDTSGLLHEHPIQDAVSIVRASVFACDGDLAVCIGPLHPTLDTGERSTDDDHRRWDHALSTGGPEMREALLEAKDDAVRRGLLLAGVDANRARLRN